MRVLVAIFAFCVPLYLHAAVLVSEIAWMGTAGFPANEWVELVNDGDAIDLTNWILRIEGKKDIALMGSISGNGYYLIERTDDETVPGVAADLVSPFGGFVDAGATLILLDSAGKERDRVNGSDGWKIGGGETKGNKTTKETAQRSGTLWLTATPTPRAANVVGGGVYHGEPASSDTTSASKQGASNAGQVTASENVSHFPVEPQIFADAGMSVRAGVVGAPITFSGRVLGLKKEPIENARMVWTFGDGGTHEGRTVDHVYYYPGEYTVVLDAASGYYSASDRVQVVVVQPNLALRSGGNVNRSFIAIENRGDKEVDLSGWLVGTKEARFMFPKGTVIGANKTIMVPSEVTTLETPEGTVAELRYPNNMSVALAPNAPVVHVAKSNDVPHVMATTARNSSSPTILGTVRSNTSQLAAVDTAVNAQEDFLLPQQNKQGTPWVWYAGAALLAAIGLAAVWYVRDRKKPGELSAGDFAIQDESRPY